MACMIEDTTKLQALISALDKAFADHILLTFQTTGHMFSGSNNTVDKASSFLACDQSLCCRCCKRQGVWHPTRPSALGTHTKRNASLKMDLDKGQKQKNRNMMVHRSRGVTVHG